MEGRVNNDRQNNRAEDADQGALGVDLYWSQGARREGDNGEDDACLSHRLSFDLENKFHEQRR